MIIAKTAFLFKGRRRVPPIPTHTSFTQILHNPCTGFDVRAA